MIRSASTKKKIAVFFLGLMTLETLIPLQSLALTSGPVQPEMTQFQPAGMSDMVDLFTGDFKYNIPLLDVDGYPINLNYSQGVGMEDEASWVGLGWNLNVGSITRQLRGIPDDHNGDRVKSVNHMKTKVTTGGRFTGRVEFTGFQALKLAGSITAGVFYDNYTGWGGEVGAGGNAGLSLTGKNANSTTLGLNAGLNSNTASGVSTTLGASISVSQKMEQNVTQNIAGNLSLSYNTREGMKELTLGSSYSSGKLSRNTGTGTYSLNTPVFYPAGEVPFKSASRTYSLDLGLAATLWNFAVGGSGYKTVREVAKNVNEQQAYGSLYGHNGKNNDNALMDFMREKDNIIVKDMNHIALPIATPDIFAFNSHAGGGQFKVSRGGTGVFFNNRKVDETENSTLGGDFGFGYLFHGGVSLYEQDINDVSQKWKFGNNWLNKGDYTSFTNVKEEDAYFKAIGEPTMEDPTFATRIQEEDPVYIPIVRNTTAPTLKQVGKVAVPLTGNNRYEKAGRQQRNEAISYLTASEAAFGGMYEQIISYAANTLDGSGNFTAQRADQISKTGIDRIGGNRKKHHLSEITMTGEGGKRLVYGIPVYNNLQREYSFALKPKTSSQGTEMDTRTDNLVSYERNGTAIIHKYPGTNEFYSEQTQPAYASSFLLTAVLSPDYVDVTGDGITDDDRGTAVKFNYTRHAANFRWRSPVELDMATLNRGQLADPDDDKGSIIYGEKEIWYLHSIETKTKIAYFITSDRKDALGVKSFHGDYDNTQQQRQLDQIRLYSKSDLTTPIKTVKLGYDQSLCKGVPNYQGGKSATQGKLTLRSVYFEHGLSTRGSKHAYTFDYNEGGVNDNKYAALASDRWGTYKPAVTTTGEMRNDEYPYSTNTKPEMWLLKTINLPTGAAIEVNYESDTYNYVQNRQAMEMTAWPTMLKQDGAVTTKLEEMTKMRFTLPTGVTVTNLADFQNIVLGGSKYLYGKVFCNLTDEPLNNATDKFDWVPCYAEVKSISANGAIIDAEFVNPVVSGRAINPFLMAAWQRMRLDYPRYAWPGYKNKIPDGESMDAAMGALSNAISNIRELKEDFNERGLRRGFAFNYKSAKSFVRLGVFSKSVAPDGKKGGGARVKSLVMRETWDAGPEEVNTQLYTYTTKNDNGVTIGSGVASYEPSIGGDENSWRQPDPYTQVNRKALNNEFYLEEPFGEALFPSPTVGYREVKVESRSGRDTDPNVVSQTGYLQYDFYTAKEFPTETENTPISVYERKPPGISFFFGGRSIYEMVMSQGYVIRTNDMHGKPRAERVFNQKKEEISATEYYYNAEERGGYQRLKNMVDVVDQKGDITKNQIIGRELDLFVDMREGETTNSGTSYHVGVDMFPVYIWIIPAPHFPINGNLEYRLFRSSSVTKTVHYTGIPQRIVKKTDGASITTYNLLFDKNTGVPLVTATDNEFNDPVYSVNIPAYWYSKRMGRAYETANILYKNLTVDEQGNIGSNYKPYLVEGDELTDVSNADRVFWVINSPISNGSVKSLRLVDRFGTLVKGVSSNFKVTRSGYRNQVSASMGSILTLEKPYTESRLKVDIGTDFAAMRVIDAKATLFSEEWGQPADCIPRSCPQGYELNAAGTKCIVRATVQNQALNLDPIYFPGTVTYCSSTKIYNLFQAETHSLSHGFWTGGASSSPRGGRLGALAVFAHEGTPFGGRWYQFVKDISVPRAGNYYLGFAADDEFKVTMNGTEVMNRQTYYPSNHESWHVMPVTLERGLNRLVFDYRSNGGERGAAFELYDCDLTDILSGDGERINPIYDSRKMLQDNDYNSFFISMTATIERSRYGCSGGSIPNVSEPVPYCENVSIGSCPPGYTQSPDGLKCIMNAALDPTGNYNIRRVIDLPPTTSTLPAIIRDVSGNKVTENGNCVFKYTPYEPMAGIRTLTASPAAMVMAERCGRHANNSIWLSGTVPSGGKAGFRTCITIDSLAEYHLGYGNLSGVMEVRIDNQLVATGNAAGAGELNSRDRWQIRRLPSLGVGKHLLEISCTGGTFNGVGVEIYKASASQLSQVSSSFGLPLIFSTANISSGSLDYDTYITTSGGAVTRRYTCSSGAIDICAGSSTCGVLPMKAVVNPYVSGHLGNWLVQDELVYLTDRSQTPDVTTNGFTRKGGAYKNFTAFWQWNYLIQNWSPELTVNWVTARQVTLYDRYSQELENKNALDQYTSARFGYRSSVPVMTGYNARSRELYYDGFEDYKYNPANLAFVNCLGDNFDIRKIVGIDWTWLDATKAHTGNYSLILKSNLLLKTQAFDNEHGPGQYIETNAAGEYQRRLDGWMGLFGFNPLTNGKYIVSMWVNDGNALDKSTTVNVKMDGATLVNTREWKASVEGWELFEFTFDMTPLNTANMRELQFEITGNSTHRLDDIRIFPANGNAKTFAYDEKTLRLMAELDANNFATLYEYDEQGQLIRVKKETDEGIITLKESRSTYLKK